MRRLDLSSIDCEVDLEEYRRTNYGMCGVNCFQNHNLSSSLSMMPMHFQTTVDDTVHWPRQNYEKDHISNVRGLRCGCGEKWSHDEKGNKRLHNLTKCAWITATGDIICGNYEKPANYALNRVKSYLDLVVKTTCRCHPSVTLSKHSEVESSRVCQSNLSNHLLRQENTYCPWRNVNCGEFCTTCLHYCGIQHG